ncbi:MAG TPA: hypothetical protein VJJ24_01400 [Candidatus Paceibacterota bacterium]
MQAAAQTAPQPMTETDLHRFTLEIPPILLQEEGGKVIGRGKALRFAKKYFADQSLLESSVRHVAVYDEDIGSLRWVTFETLDGRGLWKTQNLRAELPRS